MYLEGITLDSCLYWNIVPQYCENVIIRGVTVNSFGHGRTDGIDIESSHNVLIEYCSLDCQDDCYTMKSGRGEDGLRKNTPTRNVVIRYCIALRGAGGLVCGTEVAGGVSNIHMHDCVFDGTDQAFRFKTLRSRGGGAGNVSVERVRVNVKGPAFYCNMLGSKKWGGELATRLPAREITRLTPDFNTIVIKDIIIEKCGQLANVTGLPERPLRNVLISNVKGHADQFISLRDADSFIMKDIRVDTPSPVAIVDGCNGVMLLDTHVSSMKTPDIKYRGEPSTPVILQ